MKHVFIEGGGITSPQGYKAGVARAGIKKQNRYDLAIVMSEVEAVAAGVFTTNAFKAAPVLLSIEHLNNNKARGFVVNSGCANACTGETGLKDARCMAEKCAAYCDCSEKEIIVASTGVIGVPLPMQKICSGIETATRDLSVDNGHLAAQAIMTTDTRIKEIAVEIEIDGCQVRIGAMAKGSGMIHPNMATMLCFITSDVQIAPECLELALKQANELSFNMITVDGDTSTNDMAVILANGKAENSEIEDIHSTDFQNFSTALNEVCMEMARMIARDGEGANKLMEVRIENALSEADARLAAKSIAASNLVKTALFGEDANWGRIICALGYSKADFTPENVDIFLGQLKVAENGCGLHFDEEVARSILKEDTVRITADLKKGTSKATAWGCDLSYDYVKINADYRT